jgi:hypothetical protein
MNRQALLTAMFLILLCSCSRTPHQGLEEIRTKLADKLPEGWVCQPVREFYGKVFFIIEKDNSGFDVSVIALPYMTQKEWDQQVDRSMGALKTMLHTSDKKEFSPSESKKQLDDASRILNLPDGTYKNISISLKVDSPEFDYPGMEQDKKDSELVQAEITKLLKSFPWYTEEQLKTKLELK